MQDPVVGDAGGTSEHWSRGSGDAAATAAADRRGDGETRHGPLVLGLAAPEPVLEVRAGMLATLEQDGTALTDPPRPRLTLDPGLRPFGVRGEEGVGLSATRAERHPYGGLPCDRL